MKTRRMLALAVSAVALALPLSLGAAPALADDGAELTAVYEGTTFTYEVHSQDYKYELYGGTAMKLGAGAYITKAETSTGATVTVPAKLGGKKVVALWSKTSTYDEDGFWEAGRNVSYDLSNASYLKAARIEGNVTFVDASGATRLVRLDIEADDNLTKLDVSGCGKLSYLRVLNAGITKLNLSDNHELINLNVHGCKLKSLSTKGCAKLRRLKCDRTSIKTLNISKSTALRYLNVADSEALMSVNISRNVQLRTAIMHDIWQLKRLNASKCSRLTKLDCGFCHLNKLNVSGCKKLRELRCNSNDLTKLNVRKLTNLRVLYCGANDFTALDLSKNAKLTCLDCASSKVKKLDTSKNPKLKYLYASNSKIHSVNVLKNAVLLELDLHNCKLKKLDVSKNRKLDKVDVCGNKALKTVKLAPKHKYRGFWAHNTAIGKKAAKAVKSANYSGYSYNGLYSGMINWTY